MKVICKVAARVGMRAADSFFWESRYWVKRLRMTRVSM